MSNGNNWRRHYTPQQPDVAPTLDTSELDAAVARLEGIEIESPVLDVAPLNTAIAALNTAIQSIPTGGTGTGGGASQDELDAALAEIDILLPKLIAMILTLRNLNDGSHYIVSADGLTPPATGSTDNFTIRLGYASNGELNVTPASVVAAGARVAWTTDINDTSKAVNQRGRVVRRGTVVSRSGRNVTIARDNNSHEFPTHLNIIYFSAHD